MTDDEIDSAASDGDDEGPGRAVTPTARRLDVQLLARPPRAVPPAVAIRVLFSGAILQAGWLIVGFGMVFAWLFVGNAEIAWLPRAGTLGEVDAQVVESFDTGASTNNQTVYGARYAFELGGRRFEGTSYASGRQMSVGDAVRVEYSVADPELSRIRDMRSAIFGPAVLMVLLFPGIGVALIAFSLHGRLRALRLLRTGDVAFGRLVEKLPTQVTVNNQPVFELRFEFRTRDGRTGKASTHLHMPAALEDETEEALLYDPRDLASAVPFDTVPGQPVIESSGALGVGRGRVLSVLILPVLTLVGHGYWAWVKFFA